MLIRILDHILLPSSKYNNIQNLLQLILNPFEWLRKVFPFVANYQFDICVILFSHVSRIFNKV